MKLYPQSIITELALINLFRIPAFPIADITISDSETLFLMSYKRLWLCNIVTLAFSCSRAIAVGLPTILERPITEMFAPS